MSERTCDLLVIGAGPGGYTAALRGARLGLRTVLVEKDDRPGGTCTLRGCIPTKALLQAARVWELCRGGARTFGVTPGEAAFDWPAVRRRQEAVVRKSSLGVAKLLQDAGVTVVQGHGRLDGPGRVTVAGAEGTAAWRAERIVLAAGSRPASLPGMTPDGERIWTSDHLLAADALPASLVILGGGAVGVEFADILSAFGVAVTLVEMLPRLLPLEEPECAEVVTAALRRRKVKVLVGHRAADVASGPEGVQVTLRPVAGGDPVTVSAERLLVAVGRRPATGELGLETVSEVVVDGRGFVQVDAHGQTAAAGLYAVGDIVATPQLAHVAAAEALAAVDHAAGRPRPPLDYDRMPSCVYTAPEVASVGLGEAAARERGFAVGTAVYPFAALGKAAVLNAPHGLVKVVTDTEQGRVLGLHLAGAHATDLIGEACAALGLGADLAAWSRVVHPHPPLSEGLQEALQAAAGEALHG